MGGKQTWPACRAAPIGFTTAGWTQRNKPNYGYHSLTETLANCPYSQILKTTTVDHSKAGFIGLHLLIVLKNLRIEKKWQSIRPITTGLKIPYQPASRPHL